MSSIAKPSTLRILVPSIVAQKATTSLGSSGKIDTREVTLSTGGLTTENVVHYIKEYAKLRDEVVQTLRQLGIERSPESPVAQIINLATALSDAESQAAEARGEYQRAVADLGNIEKQEQEVGKQISTVEQLKTTGFSNEEMLSAVSGFRRILGRLPAKKLDAAQKALRALLKERIVMTTGIRRSDWVYLLVATPTENASQTLQTLLLYDFIPTDMPTFDGPDLGEALNAWQAKKDQLAREKQTLDSKLEDLRKNLAGPLNRSADKAGETLLLLRGSLRLGEGINAAHIFARLDRSPAALTLNSLQKDGVLELE